MGFGSWSITEEKELFRILHLQKEFPDWNKISMLLKEVKVERGPIQCYMRWNNNKENKESYNFAINTKINKITNKKIGSWSSNEEKKFLKIL